MEQLDQLKLPEDFVRYLSTDAPRSGELPGFPLWFELWPEREMEKWNRDYQIAEYAPGSMALRAMAEARCMPLVQMERYLRYH